MRLSALIPLIVFVSLFIVPSVKAQSATLANFNDGPLIKGFGKHAQVAHSGFEGIKAFRVAFDVAKQADAGELNRKFDSLARFLNMHAAAGVAAEDLNLALVVHGRASLDLLDHQTYAKMHEQDNPNKDVATCIDQA